MFFQKQLFFGLVCLLAIVGIMQSVAQIKPPVGIRQNTPDVHAFMNARIVVAPGTIIEKGTLVVRDGIIVAVGKDVAVPADARVWDMSGKTLYPGLIESYSDIGVPKKPQPNFGQDQQQKPADKSGPKHWNGNVASSTHAEQIFSPDPKAAEKLRGIGFTTALVVPQKGIFRGSSALLNLGNGTAGEFLVKRDIAQHCSFESGFGDEYPNSLMGAIALMRQTFLDAQWHRDAMTASAKYPAEQRPEFVEDLAALQPAIEGKQPVVFEATDEMSILRASRIAKEFNLKFWIRGCGSEYRRLDAVKATGAPVILPVNFPDVPNVQTPEDALNVELKDLRYWDEAPENPQKLHAAGITFVLTSAQLKDPTSFLGNVRKAIERGLPADAALAALTTTPAKLFGVEKNIGSLETGKLANFIVTDGDLFKEKTKISETWIDGKRYEIKPQQMFDVRGTWQALLVNAPVESLTIILKGEPDGIQGSVKAKGKESKLTNASFGDMKIEMGFNGDSLGLAGMVQMSATITDEKMIGTNSLPDGKIFHWTAMRKESFVPEPDTSKPKPPAMASFGPVYPPEAFGRPKIPGQPAHIFIKNATVWTCGPQGTIDQGDVLIENGKISKVGQHLSAPDGAVVIDGTGKHVTPGLIDCHSHTGIAGGVNETGKAITAEVRIGDVLDPDDIAIYRELAGGLTVANVLHGSANAIGGQNQVVKWRWGMLPEEMKFEGAMPGIKFALGENPKQSNWGDRYTTRYPQTREGVEQIIRDEFHAALNYEQTWKDYENGTIKIPPRRNLQNEAILEILHGKRLVHSHSYRQDEIEMLMKVSDDFGFQIGTFQHVLEGYKIADFMAKHGVGGSTFSDWWAYKFEVYDAIPYNGALMHDATVVVSYNSDSDELARRLNTEAAKAVKYGGVTQEEALKFVTLNPAKQLRIDKHVGSLEAGKDGDFVVWSGNPLSAYSICEQTWIDGRKFFDRDEDRTMSEEAAKERTILIQKALGAKKGPGGGPSSSGSMGEKEHYSCHDDVDGKEQQ